MKILQLKIRNIASIEHAEIDFTAPPLAYDPLFLITGDTGSGKTTILNAICLALFNNVPALTTIGTNDNDRDGVATKNPRQLMRKGTGECSVHLTFADSDDNRYTASWETQRAHKKPGGKMQSTVRRLIMPDGTELTKSGDITDTIKRVVGLTFDQFTRTTMLAQGQFATFMKASDDDKSTILEKLTGTEIYARIGRRIFEQFKEKERECQLLEAQIEQDKPMSDEEKTAINEEIAALDREQKHTKAESEKITAQLNWLKQNIVLTTKLNTEEKARTEALAQQESDRHKTMTANVSRWDVTTDIRRLLGEEALSLNNITGISRNFNDIAAKALPRLVSAIAWTDAERRRLDAAAATTDGATKVKDYLALVNEVIERIRAEESALKAECDGIDRRAIYRQFEDAETQIAAANNALKHLKDYRDAVAKSAEAAKAANDAHKLLDDEKSILAEEEKKRPELEKRHLELDSKYQGMKDLDEHLSEIRTLFSDTHQCPLCGSGVEHLHADEIIDQKLLAAKNAAALAREQLDKTDRRITQAKTKIKVLKQNSDRLNKEAATAETILKRAEQIAAADSSDFKNPDYDKTLDNRIASYTKQRAGIQSRLTEADNKFKAYDTKVCEVRSAENVLHEIESKINQLEGRKKEAEAQYNDIKTRIAAWLQEHDMERDEVIGITQFTEQQINNWRNSIQGVNDAVKDSVTKITVAKDNIAEHDKHRPEIADDATVESLDSAAKDTDSRLTDTITRRASLQAKIDDNNRRVQRVKDKVSRLEERRKEKNDWAALNKTFGGADGASFKKIAQSYVLRALLNKANYYLGMLSSRYRLDCDDGSLTINVVDSYHQDTVRNVGLLSGGESFVVSLSLALGLSAISRDKIYVDTLFIDEGFGTLDRNTLETVIDTLTRLNTLSRRRIGIISHVQDLNERITTQIRLVSTGPSTSRVEIVS